MTSNIVFLSQEVEVINNLKQELTNKNITVNNVSGCGIEIQQCECLKEADTLVIAFPNLIEDINSLKSKVLDNTFLAVQAFVKARMKKKFGQVFFLIPAEANGMAYNGLEDNINAAQVLFNTAQGAFTGFAKTIVKEYGKKGLNANAIYINWAEVNTAELAKHIINFSTEQKGQVLAIDNGVYL